MKTLLVRSFCFLAAGLLSGGCEKKLGEGVALQDIATDVTSIRVNIGEEGRLYAYPIPYDCTDYEFKWESADPGIATVDDFGRVTSIEVGTTTVYVSQGNIRKEFAVEIYETPLLEQATGYWAFEDATHWGKATRGTDLALSGAGFSSTEGPAAGNGAIRIERQSYLNCTHGINPTGDYVTRYTVMMDFKLPAATRACFMQTKLENDDDVDFFLRGNMYEIGVVGAYTDLRETAIGQIEAGRWYRMFIVVQLGGTTTYYINGVNVGEKQLDMDNRIRMNGEKVLLFADEDGEDETIDVAAVAFWDQNLTKKQMDRIPGF
ncbi:MAG: Ig-like domain-containing protein [Tannerella sp.]|jgi:hypothetical protein|nr:Ig-like domain-containing protein [Tannerella sp.]